MRKKIRVSGRIQSLEGGTGGGGGGGGVMRGGVGEGRGWGCFQAGNSVI